MTQTWVELTEDKARFLHRAILGVHNFAEKNGASGEEFTKPYFDLLLDVYRKEFLVADMRDSSDLVAYFERDGEAEGGDKAEGGELPLAYVGRKLSEFDAALERLAQSVVCLHDAGGNAGALVRPGELAPRLTGISMHDFSLGAQVPRPEACHSELPATAAEAQQVYLAVRAAVRGLDSAANTVKGGVVSRRMLTQFPDPAVRDAMLVALLGLLPQSADSRDRVTLISYPLDLMTHNTLTAASRSAIEGFLATQRERMPQEGEFAGVVRNLDLAAGRFELCLAEAMPSRNGLHQNGQLTNAGAMRGCFDPAQITAAADLVGTQVRVAGRYDTAADGQPRLMAVDELAVLCSAGELQELEHQPELSESDESEQPLFRQPALEPAAVTIAQPALHPTAAAR